MGRNFSTDTLKALKQQELEIARQIKAAEKSLKDHERKQRSTKLIAYGLVIYDELHRGVRRKDELMRQLDRILQQNSHRLAVGLPPLEIHSTHHPAPDWNSHGNSGENHKT